MSQSVKEDVNKGHHVKTQTGLWDKFLDTRIRLQKAVSIANRIPQPSVYTKYLEPDLKMDIQETKNELKELMDSLIELRKDLCNENEDIKINKNVANNHMQEIHDLFLPYRTQTIEKWSNKVQITSGIPLNKKFKTINQGVNTQIEQLLNDRERLIKRTQLKRNSDKIFGKEIFDDSDFYQQLLREFIESRMIDTDDYAISGISG
ncbi:6486_t:CDS:2 [Diversispora eburnea]|uniref:6486_t:CDS:1 n=1 Tax=Diversispora eburnea TaxID=1213867 RepID=A0A9N8V4N1_9GLOM|nr:6486_t:CDS:2 [Diversispora eburnea]